MFRIASFQCVRPFGLRGKKRPIPAPVSPAPSKIPYGEFSPVRLQASCQRRPSSGDPTLTSPQWRSRPRAFYSVGGLASKRHTQLLTPHTRPVALGSAIGSVVQRPRRLLWPHPRLWRAAPAYEFVRRVRKHQSFPNLLCRSFGPCRRPYPGGFDDLIRLLIHHRYCFHPPCRDSATTWSNQSGPVGCLTRLQRSLYATARFHCSLCPARAFTSELALPMSPSNSVGYDYVGNSQFPRLIFHQQDKQPYGLHTRINTVEHSKFFFMPKPASVMDTLPPKPRTRSSAFTLTSPRSHAFTPSSS